MAFYYTNYSQVRPSSKQRIGPPRAARSVFQPVQDMLLFGLLVYVSAFSPLEAVGVESNIVVPVPAGFLFRAQDLRSQNPQPPPPPPRPKWNPYKPFTYFTELKILYRRIGDDECRVCYGDQDCFVMNLARCDYYSETSDIMDEVETGETLDTAPELRFEVDSMLYNLVDRASGDPRYTDCIPFLSRYTDCTKENICLGCKTCECDVDGRWNCTSLARCRAESDMHEIDHRMLVSVIENLKKSKNQEVIRRKRSYPDAQETANIDDAIARVKSSKPSRYSTTEPLDVGLKKNWEIQMSLLDNNCTDVTDKANLTENTKVSFNDMAEWLNEMHVDIKENIPQSTTSTPIQMYDIFAETLTTAKDTSLTKDQIKLQSTKSKKTNPIETPKIGINEITKWLQEMRLDRKDNKLPRTVLPRMSIEEIFANTLTTTENNINIETSKNDMKSIKQDSDYLAFDEVLNNISIDKKNTSRRKPMLDMSPVNHIIDYMSDDDDTSLTTNRYNKDKNMYSTTVTPSPYSKLDMEAVTEAIEKSITEIVVDLLESAKMNDNLNYLNDKNFALLDYMDIAEKLNTSFPKLRPDNDEIVEINSINVMKRDIHNVSKTKKHSNVTTTSTTMTTTTNNTTTARTTTTTPNSNKTILIKNIDYLNNSVINPLTDIIKGKEKEINELVKIKSNLIDFLDNFKDGKVNWSSSERESFFNNYKQHVISKIKDDVRTSDTNETRRQKYLLKLKRDVYEVIKDIVTVQKLTEPKKLPDDLKFLIKAMKHYIHKQGFHINNKAKKDNFRRRWNTMRSITHDPIKENVVKILEVIDRDMPLSMGLYPLSRTAKKILKRIIKQHYIDEFAMIGLRVYDPNYNLTNDLRNIGTKWKKMMDRVSASPPADELYTIKILHLELSVDISKMNDALSLINFAHRRQMEPVDEAIGEEIISQISNSLDKINNKIIKIVHLGEKTIKMRTRHRYPMLMTSTNPPQNKMSFLQQIHSLLRNSKDEIIKLIKKKVPKTDVLKELAKKQLDLNQRKYSDYEKTMSSWQHNFGIIPYTRNRRSSNYADRMDRKRIKNIIPKYLRGKVHPALNKKHNKKSLSRKTNNTGKRSTDPTFTKSRAITKTTTKITTISTFEATTNAVTTTSSPPMPTSKKP